MAERSKSHLALNVEDIRTVLIGTGKEHSVVHEADGEDSHSATTTTEVEVVVIHVLFFVVVVIIIVFFLAILLLSFVLFTFVVYSFFIVFLVVTLFHFFFLLFFRKGCRRWRWLRAALTRFARSGSVGSSMCSWDARRTRTAAITRASSRNA